MRQFETLAIAVFVFQKTGNAFYVAMMLFIQNGQLQYREFRMAQAIAQ
jgi:hypothetical protein